MKHQKVLVLDFGAQYNQLIARRVRECGVYCEVHPCTMSVEEIRRMAPIGIIYSGGPSSVYLKDSPHVDPAIYDLGIPILGICYGIQLMAQDLKGVVVSPEHREYGRTETTFDTSCPLFKGLPEHAVTWMSHTDYIEKLPQGFAAAAATGQCPTAAMQNPARKFYGLQFHPEVQHTQNGTAILHNFLYEVCGAAGDWTMGDYAKTAVENIRAKVGDGKVLLALSGGVDSSVCAALLSEAIGSQLTCIFVDHGLMRKNEGDEVEAAFSGKSIRFVRVNAEERFLSKLDGVSDPERKRKIIGEEFIRVFEDEAKKLGKVDYLAQGTIYPDVIESGTGSATAVINKPPQRGRPARLRGLQGDHRAAAPAVQGRGAGAGQGAGSAGLPGVAPALPRPRPGGAGHRLHHQRKAGPAARS